MTGPNLLVGAVAAAIAIFAGLQVSAAIDDAVPEDRWLPGITVPGVTTPQGTVPGVTTPERPAPAQPARPAPRRAALSAPLYRAAAFGEVLRRVRAAGGRRIATLRVDHDDVVALAQGRGKRIVVFVRAGGQVQTSIQPLAGSPPAFALSRVRASVPGSLVRRVARRAGEKIDYLVATRSPVDDDPYWVVFVRDGRGFYRARIDGSGLQRLG